MIGTIVVPLDGSDLAEQALPYAEAIARKSNAPLHLMRVVSSDAPASAEEEARNYLREQAKAYGDRVQISVRMGHPADQIVDGVEEMTDPIIVMTTHGRSGIGRWLYGSVADKVVRGSGAPVLLIRSGTKDRRADTVRTVLVSLDGSVYSEAALPYAKEITQAFDAQLVLVRVAETTQVYGMMGSDPIAPAPADVYNEIGQQLVEEAQDYLAKVSENLSKEGVNVRTEVLEGFAADQLLALEREMSVDLIVMATRGRSGLSRLVFGSVAERILKVGTTPVMMIKPQGEIEEDDEK
jgi:nucleotide-binding universal stress UspA family protein